MIGNQIPRIRIEPDRVDTDGDGAALLMAAYGYTLDDWQKLVIDCFLGKDAQGKYTCMSLGLSVGRQNGKSEILIALCFYELIVNGGRVLFTSHQVRSVKACFRRLVAMFTDKRHPEVMQAVRKIRYGVGEESIEMNNGGSIQFMSRSRQAARGFDGISLLILDEASEVSEEMMEALVATLASSATGTRQIVYAGTAPYPGAPAEVFTRYRSACIASAGRGEKTANAWLEWSAPGSTVKEIGDLSSKELWYSCNPALNTRLTIEFTENELRTLSAEGFARERLNAWLVADAEEKELAIDPAVWERCKSNEEKPEGKTAYGVKFTLDGAEVVLSGAVIPETGKSRITLLAIRNTGDGLQWLADWLNQRYKQAACVVIDGRNGAEVLIEKLRPSGGGVWVLKDSVRKPKAQDVITAANMLINDLNENTLTWYGKQDELNESALTATKRAISGGFGFGGKLSAPIEACSLALWGCRTSRRNPQKQMRLG